MGAVSLYVRDSLVHKEQNALPKTIESSAHVFHPFKEKDLFTALKVREEVKCHWTSTAHVLSLFRTIPWDEVILRNACRQFTFATLILFF